MDDDLEWLAEQFEANLRQIQHEWGGYPEQYDEESQRAKDIITNIKDRLA